MKIALITNFCTHYRYKLFKLLAENYGWDFYFFDNPERTKEDVEHLTIIKTHPKFFYLTPAQIIKTLLKTDYDVTIKCTNNKWLSLAIFIITKLKKRKLIVWHTLWHYPNTRQYKLFSEVFLRVLNEYVDAIVVYGEHGKRFLTEKGINPKKIFIAYQTVDNELYGKEIKSNQIKDIMEKCSIPKRKKIILYVGRLIELKGIKYLLNALNMLKKEYVFLVIGSGELKDYMEKYCERNGINACFLGNIKYDELSIFYKASTVLVLPSITTNKLKEAWGLVVNEAFNQGCPVVVTDAVGAAAGGLVKDGVNGFIVPEKNPKALADAISKILTDNKLRENLSKNAIDEIKNWTYERQAKGFLDAVKYSLEIHEGFKHNENKI